MLSGERGILIKNFMEDRERLGTVSFNQCKSIFDNNIYDSLQSHKETQFVEESIKVIQDNEDTTSDDIDINEVTDIITDKKSDSKKESDNIYEHELKSILLTDLMSKKENEDKSSLKSITISPESLESDDDKKKRKKKNKKND